MLYIYKHYYHYNIPLLLIQIEMNVLGVHKSQRVCVFRAHMCVYNALSGFLCYRSNAHFGTLLRED